MKVIQVLPALNGGGVEKGTLEIGRELVRLGHQSLVISAGGSMVRQLEQEGSQHKEWDLGRKSPLTFRHIWAVRRWLRQEQPDIIHLRSRMPAWVVYLAWRGLPEHNRPHLVTTVHGLYSVSRYSAVMCKGERVLAVSETVRDYIVNNYPDTGPARINIVFRGVDSNEFPRNFTPSTEWLQSWYEQYPHLDGKQLLTLPGRLTRLKGHHDFINLISRLVNAGQPVHGLIVGGEDPKRQAYAEELRQHITQAGLSQHITFTGARADLREIFAISRLAYSLSTKAESFGRTTLEALCIGCPVIGYAHGGVNEILGRLYPAGKVPVADADALYQQTLASLVETRPALPDNCFTRQAMLDTELAIYQELVRD